MKKFLFVLLCQLVMLNLFSQGELDTQDKIFYRNERTYAGLLHTSGWGFSFRYAQRIDAFNKRIYQLDFVTQRHPREYNLASQYFPSSGRFVYGKKNYLYNLRANYGYQKELFSKGDVGGVAIRLIYSAGATVAILKPIYYEYVEKFDPNGYHEIVDKKFDTSFMPSNVLGKSSYTMGFDEISLMPGASAQVAFSFEFSKNDEKIRAIEVGMTLDAFLKAPEIMASDDNNQFLFSLFINFRFGKIISGSKAEQKAREQKGTEKIGN